MDQSSKKPKKQTKIALKLKPREILITDALFTAPAVDPPLSKENAGGRFLLAPASLYPTEAQPESGGWVTKALSVAGTTMRLKFHDRKTPVKICWSVGSAFKPLS